MPTQTLPIATSLDSIQLPPTLPPVVIVAFTRPELLEQVLSALAQQTLKPQQILAYLDGPRNPKDQILIDQCIELLKDFNSQIPTQIIPRPANLGCDRNVTQTITEVLAQHESLVYLEDDTVPNPNFYDRIARMLTVYKDQKQVFSVSGYANLPEELEDEFTTDLMVSHRIFALGWGIWADRWQSANLIAKPQRHNPFGHYYQIPLGPQTKYTLVNQFFMEKNDKTDWVISMSLAALHQGAIHVSPLKSLVKNIGFGHPEAKTYRNAEPPWINARYSPDVHPVTLPETLMPIPALRNSYTNSDLREHLEAQAGLWISPQALGHFLGQAKGWSDRSAWIKLFWSRFPIVLYRWRKGLPV
jgi:hypothetical protein